MRKYNDYKKDSDRHSLTESELKSVEWLKFKIIVPNEKEKQELLEVFEHIHYSDIDTDYVGVNQIAHQYLDEDGANIIVDKLLYDGLNISKDE